MDKILYSNPSKWEVIGRCGRDKTKRMTRQNRQKSNVKKERKKGGSQLLMFASNVCSLYICCIHPNMLFKVSSQLFVNDWLDSHYKLVLECIWLPCSVVT